MRRREFVRSMMALPLAGIASADAVVRKPKPIGEVRDVFLPSHPQRETLRSYFKVGETDSPVVEHIPDTLFGYPVVIDGGLTWRLEYRAYGDQTIGRLVRYEGVRAAGHRLISAQHGDRVAILGRWSSNEFPRISRIVVNRTREFDETDEVGPMAWTLLQSGVRATSNGRQLCLEHAANARNNHVGVTLGGIHAKA